MKLLTIQDLALILRKSVSSIRSDLSRNPSSLPPRCLLPNTLKNLWRPPDVDDFLLRHVELTNEAPSRASRRASGLSKPGRPPNTERARRRGQPV